MIIQLASAITHETQVNAKTTNITFIITFMTTSSRVYYILIMRIWPDGETTNDTCQSRVNVRFV